MTHPFPPHHINSVSINSLGWVVPSARVNADNLTSDCVALTKSCREFLSLIKADLLGDTFKRENRTLDASEDGEMQLTYSASIYFLVKFQKPDAR